MTILTHLLAFVIGTVVGVVLASLLAASHRKDDQISERALHAHRDNQNTVGVCVEARSQHCLTKTGEPTMLHQFIADLRLDEAEVTAKIVDETTAIITAVNLSKFINPKHGQPEKIQVNILLVMSDSDIERLRTAALSTYRDYQQGMKEQAIEDRNES